MNRKRIVFLISGLLIVLLSIVFGYLLSKKPEIHKLHKHAIKTPVSTIKVERGDYSPVITLIGHVLPSSQADIKAEISGKIVKISKDFTPGGFVSKDEVIVSLDKTQYIINLNKAKSNYIVAKAGYEQALGEFKQAKKQLKVYQRNLGKKVKNKNLLLRKPNLDKAKANLELAQSNIKLAQRNLNLTNIKAPFNGMIYNRKANIGSFVGLGSVITSLVKTDTYWIKTSLPVNDLKIIDLTDNKNKVDLILNNNRGTRTASIYKVLNYLDKNSRFIGLMLTVKDPILRKSKKKTKWNSIVYLEDYVKVRIVGKKLRSIFRIPLYAMKNDNIAWVANNKKLKLKKLQLIFEDDKYAYVKGLKSGDLVITSDISIVSPGMDLLVKISNGNKS